MSKIMVICADCGSDNVSTSNVSGYWNVEKQDWDYEHYDSAMYCSDCGDDGGSEEIPYDPDRFRRDSSSFEIGDTVKFEKDMRIYEHLTGYDKVPDDLEHVLAVVVDDPGKGWRSNSWGNERDTIPVRLFTGELIEVWPRDVYKFGGSDEQK